MDETMESEAKSLALGKSIKPTTQIQTGAYAKSSSASWAQTNFDAKCLRDRQWRYGLSWENITQVIHFTSVMRKEKRLCRGWVWALWLSRERATIHHDVMQRERSCSLIPEISGRHIYEVTTVPLLPLHSLKQHFWTVVHKFFLQPEEKWSSDIINILQM